MMKLFLELKRIPLQSNQMKGRTLDRSLQIEAQRRKRRWGSSQYHHHHHNHHNMKIIITININIIFFTSSHIIGFKFPNLCVVFFYRLSKCTLSIRDVPLYQSCTSFNIWWSLGHTLYYINLICVLKKIFLDLFWLPTLPFWSTIQTILFRDTE